MRARTDASGAPVRGAGARIALLGAAVLSVAATWLILDGETVVPGWLSLGAGLLLIGGASLARRAPGAFPAVLDSVSDRIFDGTILSAIAWVERTSDPVASAGALIAIAAGFLGSYVRVRGTSLGYGVTESPVTRAIRYGLVAAGLLSGRIGAAVWSVAALGIVTGILRATQVAKEERA
jgi:phosphatidylglycerophosphate synthase